MFRVVRGPDLTDKKTTTTPKTLNTEYKNNQSTVLKTKDFFDLVKNDNYNVNDNDFPAKQVFPHPLDFNL